MGIRFYTTQRKYMLVPEKYFFSLFLIWFINLNYLEKATAQTLSSAVVNSSGNFYASNDVAFEWSIGEMSLVETMLTQQGIVTHGMLQPLVPIHFTTAGIVVTPSNILTANGDGKNDVWVIKDLDRYSENELIVFDRAGRVVYKAINYKNDWAGDISGVSLSQDTYYYVLKLTKDGHTHTKKGFITIVN
ncbi:MAG: gliding motility-associated C-terminal domain-containing protein [Pyrinomonadaceae bacterium]|nr:gliding motility-associated C-terminal domain-containing protein [Sphingobacteriaceae bacterium]